MMAGHGCRTPPPEPEPESVQSMENPEELRARLQDGLQTAMEAYSGSVEPDSDAPASSSTSGVQWFCGPSFLRGQETQEVYLRSTRLTGQREGLLIDPGAFDNLVGSKWIERMRVLGHAGQEREIPAIGVEGVGETGQRATRAIVMDGHIRAIDGTVHSAQYEAPIINGSDIPALWGPRSLSRNRAVLDTVNRTLYLCGAGDIRFLPPPGTVTLKLELSSSGHLLLPFTELPSSSSPRPNRLDLNFSSVPLDQNAIGDGAPRQEGASPSSS